MTGIELLVVGAGAALAGIIGRVAWVASKMPWTAEILPWSRAAEACGLTPLSRTTWVTRPDGPDRNLRVRFESWKEGDDQPRRRTRITVEALDRGIVTLGLSPETRATERAKERGAREIETGDEGFDDEFYVTGPGTAVRAVLNRDTRVLLRSLLVEVGLDVTAGALRGLIREEEDARESHDLLLSRTLPLLLEAAARLRWPADAPGQIAQNARTDAEPGVRRENLLALVRDFPEAAVTRETLRAACSDDSDDVRVRAAIALGEEGRPVLLEVAQREDGDDVSAGRAIAALGDHLSRDDVKRILVRALRSRRAETAHECLASLGRRAEPAVIPVISRVLAIEKGSLAVSAARALAKTGLASAEPPLLTALTRDPPALRVAVAEALGRVGSTAAVLPLKEIETRYRDDATRRAARQAVASIQSRLPGASPGQLSLAATDAGSLSLAEDQTGRLSLKDGPKPEGS